MNRLRTFIPSFWHQWMLLSGAVLLLVLCIRLPAFGQLPSGLNRDEAALGYNAFSILKTGRDEWGSLLPVSITSFGDQKLPGYVYTLIPFIAVFDLSATVVRLPSFLAGIVVTLSTGLIALRITKTLGWGEPAQLLASITVQLFLAISPWGLHFSHVAYEAHLAMAFFITGLTSYWHAIDLGARTTQRRWLIITAVLWSFTLLTYHSYHIFMPLFALTIAVIDWQKLQRADRTGILVSIGIGAATITLLFGGGVLQANAIKNQGITPLSQTHLLNQATLFRQAAQLPPAFEKILFNKFGEGLIALGQNYATSVSGRFLFVHGSNHGDHNPGNANNSNLLIAPLLLVGIIGLWRSHTQSKVQTLYAWILLALVPASLTISPLHEIRMATVFPVLELFAALGVVFLYKELRANARPFLVGGVVLLSLIAGTRTYLQYQFISPTTAVRTTPYHLLAQALARYQGKGIPLITQSPSSSPYIWYLFENKVDPNWLQTHRVAYPPTEEGFVHIKSLDKISFETVNWEDIAKRSHDEPLLLFVKPTEISETQRVSAGWQLQEVLYDDQTAVYEVWKVSQL